VVGWARLKRMNLQPGHLDFLRPPAESGPALRVGLPLGAEGALFSLIYVFLTRITTIFGTPAVAALGVGHKLEVFNYFICVGMGAAATTLVGQSLGAGDLRRARRCAWRTLFVTALPVGLVTVVIVAFPRTAVAVFINDDQVVAAGVTYVLMVGMTQLFMAAEVVLLGAFAGLQWTGVPAALEISLTAVRIPLAWWLVELGWGVEGVWFAIAVTTVVKGALLAVLLAMRTTTHRGVQGVQSAPIQEVSGHDRENP
jgi:Na+-driven multidrug efflux pump